jgi:hypothetical protein
MELLLVTLGRTDDIARRRWVGLIDAETRRVVRGRRKSTTVPA